MSKDGLSDRELLARYAAQSCEAAFRELVRRHSRMVWSACRRWLGDGHLAEDAAQATFVVLARKARRLKEDAVISDWLHTTAHYIVKHLRRERARRERHEAAAVGRNGPAAAVAGASEAAAASWEEVRPLLDDALVTLPAESRQAITLHYLEGKGREDRDCQLAGVYSVLALRNAAGLDLTGGGRFRAARDRLAKLLPAIPGKGAEATAGELSALARVLLDVEGAPEEKALAALLESLPAGDEIGRAHV